MLLSILFAFFSSTLYLLIYIYTYKNYFELRPKYYIGIIFVLLTIYIQLYLSIYSSFNIGYIALMSFTTFPIGLYLVFKTNIIHSIFLAFNVIVKIYVMFLFFATLFALSNNISYDPNWIKSTTYFAYSQGLAYLTSIGSLYLSDVLLLRNKLKYFFELKRNLVFLISIQLIILLNTAWLSFTNTLIDYHWYNSMLLITSFSFEIIYFLLRLFTANSSYFSSFKARSELLTKQLTNQIDHYKAYESQMVNFMKFKHDYQKVFHSIQQLISTNNYDAINKILIDYDIEFEKVMTHKAYSNNLMLDALLNDYARRFEHINTTFNALTYIKLGQMNELDLIKLFYNILENAHEALLKVVANNRKFDISSEIVSNYLKITFINTTIETENLYIKTMKEDKENHGFGMSIIHDILEKYDGFSNHFIVKTDGLPYFHIEIFIPLA